VHARRPHVAIPAMRPLCQIQLSLLPECHVLRISRAGSSFHYAGQPALTETPNEAAREIELPVTEPSDQLYVSSKKRSFDALGSSELSESPDPFEMSFVEVPIYTPPVPSCASLFSLLIQARWVIFECSKGHLVTPVFLGPQH
jgi:hypothetical protein